MSIQMHLANGPFLFHFAVYNPALFRFFSLGKNIWSPRSCFFSFSTFLMLRSINRVLQVLQRHPKIIANQIAHNKSGHYTSDRQCSSSSLSQQKSRKPKAEYRKR